jgi:hypothetical protein
METGDGIGTSFQDIEEMNGIGRRAKSHRDNYLLTALCAPRDSMCVHIRVSVGLKSVKEFLCSGNF